MSVKNGMNISTSVDNLGIAHEENSCNVLESSPLVKSRNILLEISGGVIIAEGELEYLHAGDVGGEPRQGLQNSKVIHS